MLKQFYSHFAFTLIATSLSGIAACQNDPPVKSAPPVTASNSGGADASTFEMQLHHLSTLSCPDSAKSFPAKPIVIQNTEFKPGEPDIIAATLPEGVSLSGSWRLTSTDPAFGGLSGLDTLPSGDLLAISDAGAFVTIDMANDAPAGTGALAYMLDLDGNMLSGKTAGDSEGLARVGDLAFVSFERDHRILAFDINRCGAAARGAHVAALPDQIDETKIAPNRSAEALAYAPNDQTLIVHYEARSDGNFIRGVVDIGAKTEFSAERTGFSGYASVGSDITALADDIQLSSHLYRSYDPFRGNRNWLDIVFRQGCCDVLTSFQINLKKPIVTDNFEGITSVQLANGDYRVWIISDDNFSANQSTLLYAFDIAQGAALNIATSTPE